MFSDHLPNDSLVDGEDVDTEDSNRSTSKVDGDGIEWIVQLALEHQEVDPNEDQACQAREVRLNIIVRYIEDVSQAEKAWRSFSFWQRESASPGPYLEAFVPSEFFILNAKHSTFTVFCKKIVSVLYLLAKLFSIFGKV